TRTPTPPTPHIKSRRQRQRCIRDSHNSVDIKKYWNLYTGGLVANHIEKIGGGIDFCIIDTVHSAPGEALDFLMVLPYLSDNAVILLHDLTYHIASCKNHNICALLFLTLKGQKTIPAPYMLKSGFLTYKPGFQNIGSCALGKTDDCQMELYFRLLNIPWIYMPNQEDIDVFLQFVAKHYEPKFATMAKEIIDLQKRWFKEDEIARRYPIRIKHKMHSLLRRVKNLIS
ncbi:class I SAM-dependent methyltransferase, partial [Helicobacter sp. CLO-3]|uniref:class I SAM-dependent methyltransferase n=1 Tax=Helicobacter sp. CLO-3 TaxID=211 RepID=UPI000A5E6573